MKLLTIAVLLLLFCTALIPNSMPTLANLTIVEPSPKNIFWIKNNTSHTFKHLYIVPSEDGDADEEYEDDGTDHCLTSCADDGNQDSLFNPNEVIDLHIGKGHYDLMVQNDKGQRFIEDDIEYKDKKAGISEKNPFMIEDKNLKEIK